MDRPIELPRSRLEIQLLLYGKHMQVLRLAVMVSYGLPQLSGVTASELGS